MKNPFLTLLVVSSLCPSLQAAVTGYWRFESGGFTSDSGPNGLNLTNAAGGAAATQTPVSGSIPTTVLGSPNGSLASFDGGDRLTAADSPLLTDFTFTIEAFVRLTADNTSTKTIAGHWNSTGDQRGWLFGISASEVPLLLYSANGVTTTTVTSTLPALSLNTDYYLSVTVNMSDTSASGITFYLQDLTAGGGLLTSGVTHADTAFFDATTAFSIGATSQPSSNWTGLIDEVRLSDQKLTADQLMIPEPSSAMLAAAAGLLAFRRNRRS